MPNMTNLHKYLLRIPLNQSVTVSVVLHWFKPVASRMFLFAVSKIAMLIRPTFFFSRFMTLTAGLLLNFSLWSFRVIKLLLFNFTLKFHRNASQKITISRNIAGFPFPAAHRTTRHTDCKWKYFVNTLTWRHIMKKIPWYCKFNVLFIWLNIAAVSVWNFKFQIRISNKLEQNFARNHLNFKGKRKAKHCSLIVYKWKSNSSIIDYIDETKGRRHVSSSCLAWKKISNTLFWHNCLCRYFS